MSSSLPTVTDTSKFTTHQQQYPLSNTTTTTTTIPQKPTNNAISASQQPLHTQYHHKTLYPLYQDFILTMQNNLKSQFQSYGVHENTLREFMVLWEKLLAEELGLREGKDAKVGENEMEMLLDELDDILEEEEDDDLEGAAATAETSAARVKQEASITQVDGTMDADDTNHQQQQQQDDEKQKGKHLVLQLDGASDNFHFASSSSSSGGGVAVANPATVKKNTSYEYDEDPKFDINQYRAPAGDEDAVDDILICQYSDIEFKSSDRYIMDLARGVLYLNERDYLFSRGSCVAKLNRSEKKKTTTKSGAIISNLGATARMQRSKNADMDLNMTELTRRIQNAEYDPQKFGGHHIQVRRNHPRCTFKIFRTGTINVIGAANKKDALLAANRAAAIAKSLGVEDATIKEFRVTSIAASYQYGSDIDIARLEAFYAGDFVHQVPNNESYVDYEMKNPPVKLKIYSSGSINIADAKSEEDIDTCIEMLVPCLNKMMETIHQERLMKQQHEEALRRQAAEQQRLMQEQQRQAAQMQQSHGGFGAFSGNGGGNGQSGGGAWSGGFSNKDIDF